jgi:hypothetical protein
MRNIAIRVEGVAGSDLHEVFVDMNELYHSLYCPIITNFNGFEFIVRYNTNFVDIEKEYDTWCAKQSILQEVTKGTDIK